MKVLFAVSNEEISEAIVKRYQKDYKEIISYKNVYYFNAILKEIQKEKGYDRIIISEELETFNNSQQVEIDNSIFDKLDSISDDAVDHNGKDIPIILIASDRRTQSDEMIMKLFGIGIYNALIGKSRSIEEVCKLIKKPRIKKEAKAYYSLDTEDVTYQAVSENDVSEEEIQNIIKYYKNLGNNEDRILESFDNIVTQYNATQLRIVGKFLPNNVKDVLGRKSMKYQQIMGFGSTLSQKGNGAPKAEKPKGPTETLLGTTKKQARGNNIVIPTNVKMQNSKKLIEEKPVEEIVAPKVTVKPQAIPQPKIAVPLPELAVEEIVQPVKKGRGRPKKEVIETEEIAPVVKKGRGRPKKAVVVEEVIEESLPGMAIEEDPFEDLLPGMGSSQTEEVKEIEFVEDTKSDEISGFGDLEEQELNELLTKGPKTKITQQKLIQEYTEPESRTVQLISEKNRKEWKQNQAFEIDENYSYEEEEEEVEETLPMVEEVEQESAPIVIATPEEEETLLPMEEFEEEAEELPMQTITPVKQENYVQYDQEIDLSSLLTRHKKIVSFIGASKNGNSFLINNTAKILASRGVNVAILDATQNRSAYFVFTNNDDDLRAVAAESIENLGNGIARGIEADRNLTVYTSTIENAEALIRVDSNLEALIKKHDVILIDCDYETPYGYYKQSEEIYLVQSYDILTIQPFTVFLRDLKEKGLLDEEKLRVVLNKTVRIKGITDKTIIGGMAFYRDPAMSFMKELFDRNVIKYISVPFDKDVYVKYIECVINCEIVQKGYPKSFMGVLNNLGEMVYPRSKQQNINNLPANVGKKKQKQSQNQTQFTSNMDDTLEQMKKNF